VKLRGILLDIEGVTTPIAFVYNVLFPYAHSRVGEYIRDSDLAALKREYDEDVRLERNPPPWSSRPAAYLQRLIEQDRKSTILKEIQGRIWFDGYKKGEIRSEVFDDVPPALERWSKAGIDVRIFSSGSVLAQRLLFSSTPYGDLTFYLRGYFDTTTGPKNDPNSYRRIAEAFGVPPPEILFISDLTRELDAARQAGLQTRLCVRPGNHAQPPTEHQAIRDFDELP
jgi:enolase-phosphatase E1